MNDKYILDGKTPIPCEDIMKWGEFMEEKDAKRVAFHKEAGIEVSTVFLGLDHGHRQRTPILFETMIFHGEHDGYQERYETWEQAEAGHIVACKKAGLLKWLIE